MSVRRKAGIPKNTGCDGLSDRRPMSVCQHQGADDIAGKHRVAEDAGVRNGEVTVRAPEPHVLRNGNRIANQLASPEVELLREESRASEKENPAAWGVLHPAIGHPQSLRIQRAELAELDVPVVRSLLFVADVQKVFAIRE